MINDGTTMSDPFQIKIFLVANNKVILNVCAYYFCVNDFIAAMNLNLINAKFFNV